MIIVGVGAGPKMLTKEAIEAIEEADLIYGSDRAIELVRLHIRSGCSVNVIDDYRKLHELPSKAVVLSTGDPMLSGLGYLPGRVIPGISSMQVACARLKISQLDMVPITLHGRAVSSDAFARIAQEINGDRYVFLLTDGSTDISGLCSHLEERGLRRGVAVLTNLGYPDEVIELSRTDHPPQSCGLSCVVIGGPGNVI